MHHLTAYGQGRGSPKTPFARAIIQSPAWTITPHGQDAYDKVLATVSALSNHSVSTTAQLKDISFDIIKQANQAIVGTGPVGDFIFGPRPDGNYVPDQPQFLLRDGKFDRRVDLMAGFNAHESQDYTPHNITTDADLDIWLRGVLRDLSDSTYSHISGTLYKRGELAALSPQERAILINNEAFFTCNTLYLATAAKGASFNYRFDVPPGTHGLDVPYTFYGGSATPITRPDVALEMQDSFVRFAATGDPNGKGGRSWSAYGSAASLKIFGGELNVLEDPNRNERCTYWQSGSWQGRERT